MPNSALQFFRFGVFVLVCLLTLALAGITIHTIVVAVKELDDVIRFQIIALVAAVLTIIVLPTLGLISLVSKSSPAIWNVTELPNLGALSVIWLVAGIKTEQAMVLRNSRTGRKIDLSLFCENYDGDLEIIKAQCTEFGPIKGIAYTCFALLLFYCIVTLLLCIVAKARDPNRTVWKASTHNAHYFGAPKAQLQGQQQLHFQQQYAAPSFGYMYNPNPNQQVPVQVPMNGVPMQQGQQSYVVYVQQPPPGMMMVPISGQGQGQGQQATPPPQSQTPVSTTADSEK
ncbi:hypothetical protein PQX77_012153 [Marasmius sp. AFHP31]|nr:hypothetical protein PQX77_012153 [Marasmius sp. AFHP31]